MGKIYSFEELECWKSAKQLTVEIYRLRGVIATDSALKDQLRRAALSVMNNIAEGFGRFSSKEKIRFLEIAQSSANEVKSMIYLMQELQYINDERKDCLHEMTSLCQKQIWGFIKYLNSTQYKANP